MPDTSRPAKAVPSARRLPRLLLTLAASAALWSIGAPAQAAGGGMVPDLSRPGTALDAAPDLPVDGALCRYHTETQAQQAQMPPHLLTAISHVESGRWDDARREKVAWPWTINALGQGKFFPTKQAAITEVKRLLAAGVSSIDVGCMQINLRHHPDAFPDLETAFDPGANVAYAIQFLSNLKDSTGAWTTATGRYHSATPERGAGYRAKVMAEQARLDGRTDLIDVASVPVALRGVPGGVGQGVPSSILAAQMAAAAERQAKLAAARAERERERSEAKAFADAWRSRRLATFLRARTGDPQPQQALASTGVPASEAIETAALVTAPTAISALAPKAQANGPAAVLTRPQALREAAR